MELKAIAAVGQRIAFTRTSELEYGAMQIRPLEQHFSPVFYANFFSFLFFLITYEITITIYEFQFLRVFHSN